MEISEEWFADNFESDLLPPFSFIYDGKLSSAFLESWDFRRETSKTDDAKTKHVFTCTDPDTGLQIRCVCEVFADFPAVEWVLTLKNGGDEDTPIIEKIQPLDTTLNFKEKGEFILHRALGSNASRTDFAPIDEEMKPNETIRLAPLGGRSSNTNALPFFNIEAPGEGVMVAVGWSGQWACSMTPNDAGVEIQAGQETTHLKLHPGEEIRTPRILLLFWQGDDRMIGHNLLRRFILAHHTLQKNGKPITTPFSCNGGGEGGVEFNNATEQGQIALAKRFADNGVNAEHWWIDAGWYEGRWPNGVGNWFPRKDGFPNGLRPVADAVNEMGMGFLLWFEPERVFKDTWIDREHPEWVIELPNNPNRLFDLGDPDAIRWLTDHLSGMIESERISVFRQDFNIDPLPFWRAKDTPERQGMTEIRYVENLYALWDQLLKRSPGLIIDNCASGGRRIDLETVSRSVPLWRTDYQYFEPNGSQCHTYGLGFYLPCSGTGTGYPDTYAFRGAANSGLIMGWDLSLPDFPMEKARELIAEYKRIRPFFYGDFYPLTPHSIEDNVWIAYQFHREDMKAGMMLIFRRSDSAESSGVMKPGGLSPEAQYEVNFEDSGVKKTLRGDQLMEGIEVNIGEAPGSALITYRQL